MAHRYRLVGFDADWRSSYTGMAEYGNLPRGTYTFEVLAVDRDLDYSETPASVRVIVHLPYERMAWSAALVAAIALVLLQARRLVKRDRRVHATNAALTEANTELEAAMQERDRVERERARLDKQLEQLRYLNRLRGALEGVRTPDEIATRSGETLMSVLGSGPAYIDFDGRTWRFGERSSSDSVHYVRPLVWGARERGQLEIHCSVELSETQERVLLDETSGQIARALEAHELMAQLLQSARLVSLGEMAAGVAHELNQPLAAISTVAGDVHLRVLEGLKVSDEQLVEMMADILGMVQRMSGTIGHLRVFSRDSGDEPGVEFSINDAVESSLKVIGEQLKSHDISLTTELDTQLPLVHGHPFRIEQVLLNLIANARDALDTHTNGSRKELAIRTFASPDRADTVVAQVTDNGTGIEAAHQERLFEPFFTTKDADRGTGLGLSISYAIVQNHGGHITFQSKVGEGTMFRVELPIAAGD